MCVKWVEWRGAIEVFREGYQLMGRAWDLANAHATTLTFIMFRAANKTETIPNSTL